MTDKPRPNPEPTSAFYCYAVPVAPQEGAHRAAQARLAELDRRSRWLVKLRWAAGGGVISAVTLGRFALALPLSLVPLYATAAAILAYNAVFHAVLRGRRRAGETTAEVRSAGFLAAAQMVADLGALTALLHFSGGVENPFFFYFIFHMVIASILFSRAASFCLATVAVVLFGGLALGQYFSILPHYRLWGFPAALHENTAYLCAVLVTFASTMYLAVYFTGDIVGRLRARERELISTTTSLEKGALELQDAYQRIKALEEKKSDVLRVASHQLRAPLSAMRSLLEVAAQGLAREPGQQQELVERARARTDWMLALVNELLILSRLKDAGGFQDKSAELVDVGALMGEIVMLYRGRAEEKGVSLELGQPRGSCKVSASTEDMREAVGNLVDNAILYTPAGGAVVCRAELAGAKVLITVRDTGIGIPPEEIERVFEEFYRAPNAKSTNAQGTGLGLPIVRRAVERWNGTVRVESAPGKGAKFTIALPAA